MQWQKTIGLCYPRGNTKESYLLYVKQYENSSSSMAKPQIATRVDDAFYEKILDYADENDVSQAEAMRKLLRDGLEHDNTQELRESQQELRDEMSEVRDVIITDGGHRLTEKINQLEAGQQELERELAQTHQSESRLIVLAAILFVVATTSVSSVVSLAGLTVIGAVLMYYAYTTDFAGIVGVLDRGDG